MKFGKDWYINECLSSRRMNAALVGFIRSPRPLFWKLFTLEGKIWEVFEVSDCWIWVLSSPARNALSALSRVRYFSTFHSLVSSSNIMNWLPSRLSPWTVVNSFRRYLLLNSRDSWSSRAWSFKDRIAYRSLKRTTVGLRGQLSIGMGVPYSFLRPSSTVFHHVSAVSKLFCRSCKVWWTIQDSPSQNPEQPILYEEGNRERVEG